MKRNSGLEIISPQAGILQAFGVVKEEYNLLFPKMSLYGKN